MNLSAQLAGNAWAGLRVQLGNNISGPLYHQEYPPPQSQKKVSPSRQRRRARRLAARNTENIVITTTEEEVAHPDEETSDSSVAVVSSDIAENAVKAQQNQNEVDETQKVAEKAKVSFKCEICDFESTWENGLKIHMSRKHSKIEQVDGCQDIDFEDLEKKDTRYDETDHYWRSGRIGIAYHAFLDAISVIEESDLPIDLKEKEKDKILEARKSVFGDKFCDFPPWRKV